MFKRLITSARGFLFLDSIQANAREIESRRLEIVGIRIQADERIKDLQEQTARKIEKINARAAQMKQALEAEMEVAAQRGEKLRGDELFASLPSRVSKGWSESR